MKAGPIFGKVRTDAFDHPGTEVLFDAFQGTGWDDAEGLRLELQAMHPIVHPDALSLNVLARGNRRCGTHDGDEVPMATDLDPEDAEACLFTMERHALDGTGEVFCGTRVRVKAVRK